MRRETRDQKSETKCSGALYVVMMRHYAKGGSGLQNRMNFRIKSKGGGGGGGVVSDPKIMLQIFGVILRENNDEFSEKGGGHANPKKIVADFSTSRKKAQHRYPKRGRGTLILFVQ